MYHYTESGLPNIYLINGFTVEFEDGEEYTSIDDANGLHQVIALAITQSRCAISHEAFRFLRVELNLSQKALGKVFGVDEQTIARYEKAQTKIPRTTDAALRALYVESQEQTSSIGYFLSLLADFEEKVAAQEIHLEEVNAQWRLVA